MASGIGSANNPLARESTSGSNKEMNAISLNRRLICLVMVGVLITAVAGCDRHTKHKVLNFFFTGVPSLEEEEKAALEKDKTPQLEEKDAPLPTLYSHPLTASRQCNLCHQTTANFNMFGGGSTRAASFRRGVVTPGPLVRPRNELCIRCHKDKSAAETLAQGLWLHPTSAKGDCYACHDPHQSTNPYMLLETPRQICIPCHTDPKVMELAAHKQPGECLTCHNPHLGKNRLLLKKEYKEVKHPVGSVSGLPELQAVPKGLPIEGSTTKVK
jgi:predicted CXXCH cytochrome family protein